jgi:hypothetical protein
MRDTIAQLLSKLTGVPLTPEAIEVSDELENREQAPLVVAAGDE